MEIGKLTHRNILIIFLRLAAIFLAVRLLENFPQQWASFVSLGDEYGTPSYLLFSIIIPNLIPLLFAILLWVFPNKLIMTVVPDAAKNKDDPEYYDNLHSALISAVGVFIIAFSISDMVYFYALKQEMISQFGAGTILRPADHASFIASLAEVVIGILLVIGNKGFTQIITKIRRSRS